MPLEMRKTSQWWYGRYNAGSKVHCVNLDIAIEGERPASISQEGDRAFERSRGRAQGKFAQMVADAKAKKHSEEYVQRLHEIRTGRRIDSIPLASLAQEWEALPRTHKVAKNYVQTAKGRLGRFLAFIATNHSEAQTMADITPEMALGYLNHEAKAGLSGRTWNGVLSLHKSAFRALAHKANIVLNPFDGIPTKEMDTIHRKPFTQDELKRILAATEAFPFVRPIIVTGICTAMRLGDCCCLRWDGLDLKQGFVRVKTAKTNETVDIPIFPMLWQEFKARPQKDSEFVFPEQATMYLSNRCGVTYRVRQAFDAAGFSDDAEEKGNGIRAKRVGGVRRVSVRDFHSFRVTWITLALAAGLPMELVTRVTGHQTVDVVLKHYFRPGREDFRRAVEKAMPKMLTQPVPASEPSLGQGAGQAVVVEGEAKPQSISTAKEKIIAICQRATAETWKQDADRIATLVDAL